MESLQKSIYLHCQTESGILLVEAREPLNSMRIVDIDGGDVEVALLSEETLDDGTWRATLDASRLFCWSPDTPVLYRLLAGGGIDIRFGYCEVNRFQNKAVIFNGAPVYFRGVIRGIIAHDHPNMTGGSLYDAAVKYIRQAKKYGFNLVRFHSTIPWPEFVEAADKEGIFIHAEIGFAYERNEKGEKTSLSMDQTAWRETILKYRNCPSMLIFCIGNEMHNSGRVPQVHAIYEEGRRLAPGKLIIDNSGWGEYDRTSADIFSQHIAYFFPYGHHAEMFHVEDPWLINGSAYDVPIDQEAENPRSKSKAHRAVVPIRPTLAHEAVHYVDVPDYYALRKKFDDFCAKVGPAYLKEYGIERPRLLDDMPALIDRLTHQNAVLPRSVFSHFAGSDSADFDAFSQEQFKRFDEGSRQLQQAFSHHILRHICNSAGIERFPQWHFDMVRLGLGLYGIDPIDNRPLHNVATLRTTILQIRRVPAGDSIGYSRRTIVDHDARIAAIPIGYADGLDRRLGNRGGYCMVNGKKAPYVGNICMDVSMIDVTGIDCKEGDSVEIFGKQLPVTTLSDALGTIPYEILTSVSDRVKRVYYQE